MVLAKVVGLGRIGSHADEALSDWGVCRVGGGLCLAKRIGGLDPKTDQLG